MWRVASWFVATLIGVSSFTVSSRLSGIAAIAPEIGRTRVETADGVWEAAPQAASLETLLISAVRPKIADALTGQYGYNISFWQERILQVQQLKDRPTTLRAVIEVKTYQGAHRSVGTDQLEFVLRPEGLQLEHLTHTVNGQ